MVEFHHFFHDLDAFSAVGTVAGSIGPLTVCCGLSAPSYVVFLAYCYHVYYTTFCDGNAIGMYWAGLLITVVVPTA
jgi:hypothetical protein